MAQKVIVSKQGYVSLIEWLKSAGYAVGTTVLYAVQSSIEQYVETGNFDLNWSTLAKIAIGAFALFVTGKAVAKPHVKTVYNSNKKAVEVAEDIKK